MSTQSTGSASAPGSTGGGAERPGSINAVPVRHPGRWLAVVVILVLAAKGIQILVTNPAFDWNFIGQAMVQSPVIHGLVAGTIVATFGAMAIGVALGVLLAVMRLSENKVLSYAAWFYIWFFRGVPRYVLLALMGALGVVFPPSRGGLGVGIPFGPELMKLFGLHGGLQVFSLDANHLLGGILGGILGLGLSEAAYMAEIARAGILSVDPGQQEAAYAIGMSRGKAMWRVVLPQAMRVIVPPTGNETIGMFKDTTLMTALPVTVELFYQLNNIGLNTFKSFDTDVAAILWYLVICSVMMFGQMHLERYFGRGFGSKEQRRKLFTFKVKALSTSDSGGHR
ncbi:ABC transporter permease [Nocardioides baekrokdamisoli]|uniref:ABC transporter permease n=1 Tax=Nocardioides baekrokdamisoli TaxID=1804624 RepID=A0A3G9IGI0_9ACTN|nr:amino acid ABC transporter permease [Nocardioides baekrokdamisoli]BBH18150.1 ABC transporter permease [Nocardioides baekrokdamisoli]